MFTSFSLLRSRTASYIEHHELRKLLDYYAATEEGKWLQSLNYRSFTIKWCDAMATDNTGIMGAFAVWSPTTIYLLPLGAPPPPPGFRDTWLTLIAPTLVHELRHAWQYRKSKLLYALCCLPGLRAITLERDAWRQTQPAQKYFETLEKHRSAAEFAARSSQNRENQL